MVVLVGLFVLRDFVDLGGHSASPLFECVLCGILPYALMCAARLREKPGQ